MDSNEFQAVFASNIRKFRILNNLTQMKLAEMVDLSVGYICDLERGKKWGTPETITKLSAALNVQPYQFFLASSEEKEQSLLQEELLQVSANIQKKIDEEIKSFLKRRNESGEES